MLSGLAAAEAALDRRLDSASPAPVAVALSGGGDSLALLHVALGWASAHGRPLLALSVDHDLHAESGRWTAFAGEAARRLGADWRALSWGGEKPRTGLPAAARAARHRLIADAAREAGAKVVLFGHTADDVDEAELMREDAAPALGRLRAWSPSPVWPEGRGVFLLRPLLDVRRAELRTFLTGLGERWLEDPANSDLRFARARARAALHRKPADPRSGAPFQARQDEALARLARYATTTGDGRVLIARDYLREGSQAAARRFAAAALLCASGGERPPRGEQLDALLARAQDQATFTATLAGARVVASTVNLTLAREAGERRRGALAPLPLAPGRAEVWDGRFEIIADAPGLTVAPVTGRMRRLAQADREKLKSFAAFARPALPALVDETGQAALPRPFGTGPGQARALAGARLKAACGLIVREAEIS